MKLEFEAEVESVYRRLDKNKRRWLAVDLEGTAPVYPRTERQEEEGWPGQTHDVSIIVPMDEREKWPTGSKWKVTLERIE